MAAPDKLTISAAARLCGVDRRTLQRAIHAGRLHLDAAHCLHLDELRAAGYLRLDTPHTPQAPPQPVPQGESQPVPQATPQPPQLFLLLGRLTLAVEGLWAEVRQLRADLRQTPQVAPQARGRQQTAAVSQPVPPPDVACPPFDATKNVLGRLCPRGHEWGTTGQSLLRLPNQSCRQCENDRRRERRAAQRKVPPS
jgi:hypothetical protein